MMTAKTKKLLCIAVVLAVSTPFLWGAGWVSYYALRNKVLAHYFHVAPDDHIEIKPWDWFPRSIQLGIWLANPGGTVTIPDGDRTLAANLLLNKAVRTLWGHGETALGSFQVLITNDGAQIVGVRSFNTNNGTEFTYSGTGVAFDIGDGTNAIFDVTLKGFKLRTTGAAITSATAEGIRIRNDRYAVFEDVAVLDFQQGVGIHFQATDTSFGATSSIVRPQLWQNDVGILVDGTATKVNHLTIFGGFVLRGSITQAGTIGINLDDPSSGARIISTDVEGYAQGFRVAGDNHKISARSEDNTTHIDIIATANRTTISSAHQFFGSGTQVVNAPGTGLQRWDTDAPIALKNDANSGFGEINFQNQAGISMEEAGGTERVVMSMLSNDVLHLGISTNQTSLRGSKIVTAGESLVSPLEGSISNTPRWIFKQVDHTDMTAAATADTFTLWTLPANTMIHDVVGTVVTAWEAAVGLSAAVCSVGTAAGSANDLTLDDDFFAVATVFELHDATASGGKGAKLFDSTDKFAPFMLVASGDIEIQCDLTGDDHADTNAGQARIYILVSQPLGNTATEAN